MKQFWEAFDALASAERSLTRVEFIAPRVTGTAHVKVSVEGLIHTFSSCKPADWYGWGMWRALDMRVAMLVKPASLAQVEAYLSALPRVPLILIRRLCADGQRWLALPANASDARQRVGASRTGPCVVELVGEGDAFDHVVAGWDGARWWYESLDVRAEFAISEAFRDAFEAMTPAESLAVSGSTPEQRRAYEIAWRGRLREIEADLERSRAGARERLRAALAGAGGELRRTHATRDASRWVVEWSAPNGALQTSVIDLDDLSVVSAGLCLDGEDHKFDLESLVGVVEKAHWFDH